MRVLYRRTVLFRGIGLSNDRANKLAIEVLAGTTTSYAYGKVLLRSFSLLIFFGV